MEKSAICKLQNVVREHPQLDQIAHGPELRPVLPLGPRSADICFVGRDPGEMEARSGLPFLGDSGVRIRNCLLDVYAPYAPYSDKSRLDVGERFFWFNTVPFKPKANKAWSQGVRDACQPILVQLLHEQWAGSHVVTFGREAFFWFGIGQPKALRRQLNAFWQQGESKYGLTIDVPLGDMSRVVRLHPMPHPSTANARWRSRFSGLLKQRLVQLVPLST